MSTLVLSISSLEQKWKLFTQSTSVYPTLFKPGCSETILFTIYITPYVTTTTPSKYNKAAALGVAAWLRFLITFLISTCTVAYILRACEPSNILHASSFHRNPPGIPSQRTHYNLQNLHFTLQLEYSSVATTLAMEQSIHGSTLRNHIRLLDEKRSSRPLGDFQLHCFHLICFHIFNESSKIVNKQQGEQVRLLKMQNENFSNIERIQWNHIRYKNPKPT